MENAKDPPESSKNVHEILRERRGTLDRVRASLRAVDEIQKQFAADSRSSAGPLVIPGKKLHDLIPPDIKTISINRRSISLVLNNHEIVEVAYASAEALRDDLRAWTRFATAEDLRRLNIPPML